MPTFIIHTSCILHAILHSDKYNRDNKIFKSWVHIHSLCEHNLSFVSRRLRFDLMKTCLKSYCT